MSPEEQKKMDELYEACAGGEDDVPEIVDSRDDDGVVRRYRKDGFVARLNIAKDGTIDRVEEIRKDGSVARLNIAKDGTIDRVEEIRPPR